jgi:hypothetical protein
MGEFIGANKFIKLKALISLLEQFPFYLANDEAEPLARFLVEADKGKGYYMETESVQELNVIMHRFRDIIPAYDLWSYYQEHQLFKSIRYVWRKNEQKLIDFAEGY